MKRTQVFKVHSAHHGLSLLEVLLALAILGGALVTIGELHSLGRRAGVQARDLTTAQILCESKLAEIVAGITPTESVLQQPLGDETLEDSSWLYSIESQEASQPGLLAVQVTVEQDPKQIGRPVRFSLVRWVVDPNRETAESNGESNGESGTGGSSSGSSPSSSSSSSSGAAR